MAARCSLAVRDSLSTSICCLQSEFWLLRVSSFVCRANSSDSFLDNSCFSWSIYMQAKWCFVIKQRKMKQRTVWTLFSSTCCSLIKNAFGSDSPAFIIFYTSSLFMIDERNPKNRTTKQPLVCHAMSLFGVKRSDLIFTGWQHTKSKDRHLLISPLQIEQRRISANCGGDILLMRANIKTAHVSDTSVSLMTLNCAQIWLCSK